MPFLVLLLSRFFGVVSGCFFVVATLSSCQSTAYKRGDDRFFDCPAPPEQSRSSQWKECRRPRRRRSSLVTSTRTLSNHFLFSLSLFMLVFFFLCSSPFLVSTRHYETYRRFYRVLLGLTATLYEPYSVFVYYYRVKLSSGDPSRFRVSYFFCLSSICIRFYWILLVEHKDEPSSTNYSQILFRVLASVTCF